jgi:membrane protein DedA with SNARE-associated domain
VENYIAQYGYAGIIIGTFFEGETTVLLGGIFSKLGYMNLWAVALCAFAGTFGGDCAFFAIGRYLGKNIVERFTFIRRRIPLADRIIHKKGNLIIFMVRFLVGIRAIILILLGCTNLKTGKFLCYSLLNSVAWTIFVSAVGFAFGNIVLVFVNDIKKHESLTIALVLAFVLVFIFILRHIIKKKENMTYGNE